LIVSWKRKPVTEGVDILQIVNRIIDAEGDYVNHPHDRGGPTRYGITEAVARKHGFAGDMKLLPRSLAVRIYVNDYYTAPQFDRVALLSPRIAFELTDTGVNMGPGAAARMFQRCLNVFNRMGELYPDIVIDGDIGNKTMEAFRCYLKARRIEGEEVLLKSLNCLQGNCYIELCESREKNESFVYGWMRERVSL
jgi:lysozyme family protein